MNEVQQKLVALCEEKRTLRVLITMTSKFLVENTQNPMVVIKVCEYLQVLYAQKEDITTEILGLM